MATTIAILGTSVACAPTLDDRADLTRRVSESDPGATYTFSYRALGSSILDCTTSNRTFAGRADRNGVVIFDDQGQPLVLTSAKERLLHKRLFAPGTSKTTWIEISDEDEIAAVIGPDLASFAGPTQPPLTPWDTLKAALDEAGTVERLDAADSGGAATFVLTIDADESTVGDNLPIRLEAQFTDEHTLGALTIQRSSKDGREVSLAGWTVTLDAEGIPPRPVRTNATQFSELDQPIQAAPSTDACKLGGS